MKNSTGLGLALLLFVSNVNALDFGVAAKAGINGVGLDLSIGLSKNLNLRFLGAAIDIEGEEETVTVGDSGFEGDIDSELDFDYGATAVLLDWHAFDNKFLAIHLQPTTSAISAAKSTWQTPTSRTWELAGVAVPAVPAGFRSRSTLELRCSIPKSISMPQ
jgi:hypothetical protein